MKLFDKDGFNYDEFLSIVDRVGFIRPEDVENPSELLQLAESLVGDLKILSRGDRQTLNSYEVLLLISKLLRIFYISKGERTADFNLLLKKIREIDSTEE